MSRYHTKPMESASETSSQSIQSHHLVHKSKRSSSVSTTSTTHSSFPSFSNRVLKKRVNRIACLRDLYTKEQSLPSREEEDLSLLEWAQDLEADKLLGSIAHT